MIKTVGAVAGDEESYTLFKDFFDPVISDRHNGYAADAKVSRIPEFFGQSATSISASNWPWRSQALNYSNWSNWQIRFDFEMPNWSIRSWNSTSTMHYLWRTSRSRTCRCQGQSSSRIFGLFGESANHELRVFWTWLVISRDHISHWLDLDHTLLCQEVWLILISANQKLVFKVCLLKKKNNSDHVVISSR